MNGVSEKEEGGSAAELSSEVRGWVEEWLSLDKVSDALQQFVVVSAHTWCPFTPAGSHHRGGDRATAGRGSGEAAAGAAWVQDGVRYGWTKSKDGGWVLLHERPDSHTDSSGI